MRCSACGCHCIRAMPHQRYCSRRCRQRAYEIRSGRRRPLRTTCDECGQFLYWSEVDLQSPLRRFCDGVCRNRAWRHRKAA